MTRGSGVGSREIWWGNERRKDAKTRSRGREEWLLSSLTTHGYTGVVVWKNQEKVG